MKVLFFIIKSINTLIPKSKNKIIFISHPDFSDNTKHMYDYINEKQIDKQLCWLIYDKDIYDILIHKGHKNIFYLKSISGAWEYLRSKFIITSSSSLWQIKSPLQKQFDLWHGIPLKNMLSMETSENRRKRQAANITMRFATSNLEKAQLAASFDYSAMNIKITGQPRTDALFNSKKKLSGLTNKNVDKYDKVVCYMPTYRNGYKDKQDGSSFDVNNIFRMDHYAHQVFLDFLKTNNILFLLKLHPYEEKLYKNIDLGENIEWLTHTRLINKSLDIYDILHEVDILLTDYSSVYLDFLLLDKKVVFLPIDIEQYKSNRGFQLEPYEFWTPGEKVFYQEDLQNTLLKNDTDSEKIQRKTIRDIMFTYQDSYSSKRVYDAISSYIEG